MIKLTLNKVLWITVGCLVMVIGRTAWVLAFPDARLSLAASLQSNSALWASVLIAAQALLFVEYSVFAGTLARYNRQRPGDLVPERVLWSLALALVFLAVGAASAIAVVFAPIYPSWILCNLVAALCLGACMREFPLAMHRLARRRPMTELEATVAYLRSGEAEAARQREAIGDIRLTLARVSQRLGEATTRADSMLDDLETLAQSLERAEQREEGIYELITVARTHAAAVARADSGAGRASD